MEPAESEASSSRTQTVEFRDVAELLDVPLMMKRLTM